MEPVSGMSALVAAVSALVTGAISWMSEYIQAITASGNEMLLLCCVAVPLVGLGVGLVKRLITIKA